ncbi:MAG: tetratricopeptide repeat protein [Verrucomicrobiales bacterium]|nr:tetratricopeptide repeat protein [Verrucomicrobiales bacterium]
MNPIPFNDPNQQVHRCRRILSKSLLIRSKLGEALIGSAFLCTLAAASVGFAADSGDATALPSTLEDRAEVYVDRFLPANPRTKLRLEGQLRADALAHYSRALAFEKEKDSDAALLEYQKVLSLSPANVLLAHRVAYLQASIGKLNEARAILEKSLALNPENPQAYLSFSDYLSTYHAHSEPDRQRALQLAQQAVERFPENAAVYNHLVQIYLVRRQTKEAKALINAALKLESDDADFWLKIAGIAQKVWPLNTREGQRPVLLNGIYQKALDHSKERIEIQEAVAGFYHSSHQPQKARDLYEKILQNHPDQLITRKKLALVYQVLGQQEKVIETLRTVIQINPQDAKTYRLLAEIYRARKDANQAAHYLQQALKISKGSQSEYLDLAQLLLSARRPQDAVPVLERAVYYYPQEPFVTFLLAVSRTRAKLYQEALPAFARALHLAKETQPALLNEQFYFQYGASAERAGKLDQAADLFRKSMAILAKNGIDDEETKTFTAQVYNYLGYMWLENDMHIDEAGELIKTAYQLTPESGAILDSLGWFYFKKKNYEKARVELVKSMELMEDQDPTVYDHLARTYFELGKQAEALQHMQKALELDSDNKEFAERLKQFKQSQVTPDPKVPKQETEPTKTSATSKPNKSDASSAKPIKPAAQKTQ